MPNREQQHLSVACKMGDTRTLVMLVEKGASTQDCMVYYGSARSYDASRISKVCNPFELPLLICEGLGFCSPKIKHRRSALSIAASSGHTATVKALLEVGADPNWRRSDVENTTLIWAAWRGDIKMIEMLVEAGVDIKATCTNTNEAAFISAVLADKLTAAQLLVKVGADAHADLEATCYMKTVMEGARRNCGEDSEMVSWLEDLKSKPPVKPADATTAASRPDELDVEVRGRI